MSTPTSLEKQILATIVYYDILDYPLTSLEVFLYLVRENKKNDDNHNDNRRRHVDVSPANSDQRRHSRISPSEIIDLLNTSKYLKKYLNQKYGFYFLKKGEKTVIARELQRPKQSQNNMWRNLNTGLPRHVLSVDRQNIPRNDSNNIDIVQQRLDRKKLADQKWKKIKKIFWIMQITPFMKMILVSGSLALGNSKDESDIDLIIIAKKKRIWIVRTFVTLLTYVLGVRRHSNVTKNKICLNHYITDKSLKIPFESLYNAQSYLHLINIYDSKKDKKLFRKFQEENGWIKKYVENYELSEIGGSRSMGRNKILNFISKIFEFILSGNFNISPNEGEQIHEGEQTFVRLHGFLSKFGDIIEKRLSVVQSERIKKDPLYKKSGGRITINNNQLEFHPDSHEADIIPEFNRRMEELKLFEFGGQKDSGLTHSIE